ncbi:hypothetical protein BaRGS_00010290, partial [Batillaria attramentaria]
MMTTPGILRRQKYAQLLITTIITLIELSRDDHAHDTSPARRLVSAFHKLRYGPGFLMKSPVERWAMTGSGRPRWTGNMRNLGIGLPAKAYLKSTGFSVGLFAVANFIKLHLG